MKEHICSLLLVLLMLLSIVSQKGVTCYQVFVNIKPEANNYSSSSEPSSINNCTIRENPCSSFEEVGRSIAYYYYLVSQSLHVEIINVEINFVNHEKNSVLDWKFKIPTHIYPRFPVSLVFIAVESIMIVKDTDFNQFEKIGSINLIRFQNFNFVNC